MKEEKRENEYENVQEGKCKVKICRFKKWNSRERERGNECEDVYRVKI